MSDYEKRIRSHRKHIIERILTMACPRCSRAFLGFDGCFALKCSAFVKDDPNSCCQFCAYCLKDCGQDAHPHVLNNICPGNKGLFGSQEDFEDSHRSRRERLLRECVYCLYFVLLYFAPFIMLCVCCCAYSLCWSCFLPLSFSSFVIFFLCFQVPGRH